MLRQLALHQLIHFLSMMFFLKNVYFLPLFEWSLYLQFCADGSDQIATFLGVEIFWLWKSFVSSQVCPFSE